VREPARDELDVKHLRVSLADDDDRSRRHEDLAETHARMLE